jgi:hypothetical protein
MDQCSLCFSKAQMEFLEVINIIIPFEPQLH